MSNSNYAFSAEPKVVKARSKYRELTEEEQQIGTFANIMWDKRVVRGNTYAAIVTTSREPAQQQRTIQPRRINRIAQPLETAEYEVGPADISTPRAVEGRKHVDIVTDENVELLTDKPPCYEKDAQTEYVMEKPVERLYMPVKTGEDRETQIWDGELFNFDHEVEPILQVLMGKTLEQGRMEVLEEEELRIMKSEQKRYDELRYAEMAEAQRMLNEEKKLLEENERRKKQHKIRKEQNVLIHQKLISRVLAKEYLQNVRPNSLGLVRAQGVFQHPFDLEFNRLLLPFLTTDILHLQEGRAAGGNTITSINSAVEQTMAEIHKKAVDDEMERRRLLQEERARIAKETKERREKRAELRKKRDEEERRRQLQEKITELLLSKGEEKPGTFAQILSDMDSLGKDGNTVGLVGGVIGELLLILSTIEEFKTAEPDDPLAVLKSAEITKEIIQKLVEWVIGDYVKDGTIEIGVTGETEAEIQELDADLNLDNIYTKPSKADDVREILSASINSLVLNILEEHAEELGIKAEYIETIISAIITNVLNPDESAPRVKLVKTALDHLQDPRFEAIAVLMPTPNEETAHYNLNEVKGIKSNRQRKKSKKDSLTALDEAKVEPETTTINPADIDYEDAVTVFPLVAEEIRVLVNQRPASIVFRREVLLFLSTLFKDLDMREIEVLKRVNNKAEKVEEVISNKFGKKLDIIVFDRY